MNYGGIGPRGTFNDASVYSYVADVLYNDLR